MMNDKSMNPHEHGDEAMARKLNQIAEQTQAGSQFAARLEEGLRASYRPQKIGWFRQVSPALRWVALMALLALVLSWSIRSLAPAPQPALPNTPAVPSATTSTPEAVIVPEESATTPVQGASYDFRGGTLTLSGQLPESPAKAHVYLLKKDTQATEEQARTLADKFGIQGEMYTEPNYVFNTTNYVFSDGKQQLSVYSDRYYSYVADMAKVRRIPNGIRNEEAEAIIHAFLRARNMDFPFEIQASDFFGGYSVRPLAPDSIPMQYESFTWPPMRVALDENGEVLSIDATLPALEQPDALGEYDILSAQEALDKLRDEYAQGGKSEFFHSANNMPQEWYRTYPDNQPVTLSGSLSKKPAADSSKPPLLLIDGSPLTGNIAGLEALDDYTFLKAAGQFIVENGIRKFNLESWDRNVNEAWVSGQLSRQGDQVIITSDDGSGQQYTLIDPPADLPIGSQPENSSLGISGLILNNELSWSYIQFFENNTGSGGGGGGGGLGFYKLNLSGTPVPFPPTQAPQAAAADASAFAGVYTVKEGDTIAAIASKYGISVVELGRVNGLNDLNVIAIGQTLKVPGTDIPEQRFEDLRGTLNVTNYTHADGTATKEYLLAVTMPEGGSALYTLEGPQLGELDAYNGLPILVNGVLKEKLNVESYKIPFPDLQFQILRGTEKVEEVGGQNVVVFTIQDGKSYVEYVATNNFPKEQEVTGYQGDLIDQEVLIIPDESFGGLPVAHVYQSALVQENGPAMEIRANVIRTYDDSYSLENVGLPETPRNLTIDTVELIYYVSNPYYQAASDPNYDQRSPYIQPVWHFRGHYEDGSELDVTVQALKEQYLLPELSPGISPG